MSRTSPAESAARGFDDELAKLGVAPGLEKMAMKWMGKKIDAPKGLGKLLGRANLALSPIFMGMAAFEGSRSLGSNQLAQRAMQRGL